MVHTQYGEYGCAVGANRYTVDLFIHFVIELDDAIVLNKVHHFINLHHGYVVEVYQVPVFLQKFKNPYFAIS